MSINEIIGKKLPVLIFYIIISDTGRRPTTIDMIFAPILTGRWNGGIYNWLVGLHCISVKDYVILVDESMEPLVQDVC